MLVAGEDILKTPMTTPLELFVFVCVPSGLRDGAKMFQIYMDNLLQNMSFVQRYTDDSLNASPD